MLVGPTGSGKTSNYQLLEHAINRIAIDVTSSTDEELKENPFRKVVKRVLNPKAILNENI